MVEVSRLSGFLICLASTFFLPNTAANEYRDIGLPVIERFTSLQHKGTNQNWWLVQGENGYIYNGTGRGLNQWDGERWFFYPSPNRTLLRSISVWTDGALYTGSMNEVGVYKPDDKGALTYHSLLSDWSFEQRQFGEVWSTAANSLGVLFVTDRFMLWWDGTQLNTLDGLPAGNIRVHSIDDVFWFKQPQSEKLLKIGFVGGELQVENSGLVLPKGASLRTLFKNKQGDLVAVTAAHGIFVASEGRLKNKVSPNAFNQNTEIYSAIQASDGYYYLTTLYNGIYILSPQLKLLRQYRKEHGLESDKFYSVLEDSQGNIWLSGVPDILKFIPPHRYSRFTTESDLANKITLFQNKISVTSDGLFQLQYSQNPLHPPRFVQLLEDIRLSWDTTEFKGHAFHAGYAGIVAHKIQGEGQLGEPITVVEGETGKAFAFTPDGEGLFASTNNGVYVIREQKGGFSARLIPGTKDEIIVLAVDDEEVLWGGTPTQELYRISHAHNTARQVVVEKFAGEHGIGPNNVVPYSTRDGIIVGTNDGVMTYDSQRSPKLEFVKDYAKIFSTPGQDVFRLHQDHLNRLWYRIGVHTGVATEDENGFWQVDETLFKPFKYNGYKGFLVTDDNTLWFISAKGEVFRVNIRRASTAPPKGILNIRHISDINTGDTVFGGIGKAWVPQLDQKTNSLRFTFALAENSDDKDARYRHRLIGADNQSWSIWGSETSKDFTQLPGGDYRFDVEARDGWGRVSSQSIAFNVLPPWYLSNVAWAAYVALLVLLLILSGWLTQRWRTRVLKQRNLELEQQVALRTADVEEKARLLKQQQIQKDRFFANVSHEFRTPITLTIAPLQDVLKSEEVLEPRISAAINTAYRNARKMLSMIGEILDINKLEDRKFVLKVGQHDLTASVRNVCERFQPWIEQHQQTIVKHNLETPCPMYFDQEQLERCIENLLSNAVKYAGVQTTIEISIAEGEKGFIGVVVKDNGPGLDGASRSKVFERYYQGHSSEQVTEPGTGIGLALVKELMELHHGRAELLDAGGIGCTFALWLRTGKAHFSESELLEENSLRAISDINPFETLPVPKAQVSDNVEHSDEDITTLLVVDDNAELRHFISLTLSDNYRIVEASDGQQGLSRALECLPDLVISDVMMPVMDGMEMTKRLKTDPLTDSIPVILLTAKATKRETVEGLTAGADDYLTKPFDTSELVARVNSIINNRKSVRASITRELTLPVKDESTFSAKIRKTILEHLTDPGFSADALADLLAMSPRTLRRKCREELDCSVVQMITSVRMEVAHTLIQDNNKQVSEVAYATGFESLAYFSRTYKKHYGYSPSARHQVNKVSD